MFTIGKFHHSHVVLMGITSRILTLRSHDLVFEKFPHIHNYQRHNLFHLPFLKTHMRHRP